MHNPKNQTITEIYDRLFACFGPQQWWPGDTPFEVMVGAILTQSASWHNVEIAIHNLKQADALHPESLRMLPQEEMGRLIHSSGYYNAKARKLKALAEWLGKYGDDIEKAFEGNIHEKRQELLAVHGIGQETADSILLYAAEKPVFVIDAYTRRIMEHIGITPLADSYDAYQRLFMSNLRTDTALFNEYHALLVKLGKDVCRKKPLCQDCCLKKICNWGKT
jgi:endonuclease-3 related protein